MHNNFSPDSNTSTQSLWQAITHNSVRYPQLREDIEVDVAIIGGGITGITAARELCLAGKTVAVLEAHEIGGVTTQLSTGNLYVPVQAFYQNIEAKFNLAVARKVAQARHFAIQYIENNVQENNLSCHFTRRPWYLFTTEHNEKKFQKEYEVLQAMQVSVEYTNELPFPMPFKKAMVMHEQARFNPFQYVVSSAEYLAKKQNCFFYENTRVQKIEEKKYCTLHTEFGKVRAQNVIHATHTPIGINSKQMCTAPYRSYVIAVRTSDGKYPEGHCWDLAENAPTLSTHSEYTAHPELILLSGSHHKTGQEKNMLQHFANLEAYLKKYYSIKEVAYRWSAQHYQSADDLPYIGLATRHTKNIYLATGYWADGLTYGTLAGVLLSDAILNKKNNFSATFKSTRFTPKASSKFLMKENSNVFVQYLKDIPLLHQAKQLKKGEAKVLESEREKWAVFCDEQNTFHIVSAVCPHMKCIVNWNTAEKTWDCPCHGSRFTVDGEVIEGPAQSNLPKKEYGEI